MNCLYQRIAVAHFSALLSLLILLLFDLMYGGHNRSIAYSATPIEYYRIQFVSWIKKMANKYSLKILKSECTEAAATTFEHFRHMWKFDFCQR